MKEINRIPDFRRNIGGGEKRSIPVSGMIKIWFSKAMNTIGLFFFIFGAIFTLIFVPFKSIFGESATEKDMVTEGKVIQVSATGSSINEETVYKFVYSYNTPDGEYTDVGFATGEIFDKGDDLVVYYKQRKPQVSMVPELRKSEFTGWVGIFVAIFPAIGLILMFFGTRNTLKDIKVLRVGELTKGKLIFKEATNTKINEQTVYALTFEFTAKNGQTHRAVVKTHRTFLLEDEPEEQLFYDPNNPEAAVMVDSLPASVKKFILK